MKQQSDRRLLILYYAATVVFLILDYGFNVNIRVAALDQVPVLRGGYYLVIFACLGLMLWRPAWATLIGVFESLATLVSLIMSMALRSMIVTTEMLETGAGFVTPAEVLNFMISGSVAYYAWDRGMKSLFGPRK